MKRTLCKRIPKVRAKARGSCNPVKASVQTLRVSAGDISLQGYKLKKLRQLCLVENYDSTRAGG